jgi:hypothetical protein
MAITEIGVSGTTGYSSSGTSVSLAKPAGTEANDILLVRLGVVHTPTITTPAGWTKIAQTEIGSPADQVEAWYWLRYSSGGPWTFEWSSSQEYSISCVAYRGCETSASPIDVFLVEKGVVSGKTVSHPGLTTTHAEELLVLTCSNEVGFFWSAIGGSWSSRSSTLQELWEDKPAAIAGATGSVSASMTTESAAAGWSMMMLALRPKETIFPEPPSRFPNTPLLDEFKRPDGELGPNYAAPFEVEPTIESHLMVASNALCYTSWKEHLAGGIIEGYVTLHAVNAQTVALELINSLTWAETKGYFILFAGSGSTSGANLASIWKFNAATHVEGSIASAAYTPQVGDTVGMSITPAGLITAWYKREGEWHELCSATDTTYPREGYLSIEINSRSEPIWKLGNFGGGVCRPAPQRTVLQAVSRRSR